MTDYLYLIFPIGALIFAVIALSLNWHGHRPKCYKGDVIRVPEGAESITVTHISGGGGGVSRGPVYQREPVTHGGGGEGGIIRHHEYHYSPGVSVCPHGVPEGSWCGHRTDHDNGTFDICTGVVSGRGHIGSGGGSNSKPMPAFDCYTVGGTAGGEGTRPEDIVDPRFTPNQGGKAT